MYLPEMYEWMDTLGKLAFSSSEKLENRIAYAEWWLNFAYRMVTHIDIDAIEQQYRKDSWE